AYDKITNKIVALGRLGKYFALQTFDGKEWGLIHIPFTLKPSSSGPIRAITVEVDLKGNYYVAIHEFLGKWDGEKWVRMTLTNTADSLHEPYMERYRLPVVDSAGGVWIGAKINEYMAETDDFELREFIARIDGDNVEVIDADLRGSTIPNGICKRNGDVIMDTFFEDIYYFRDLEIEILSPDDGDDHPDRNTSKGIYTNKNDDLVVVFESGEIWTSKYGTYYRTGGIAVYQNGEWDYDKYGDIVKEYELEMNSTVFLSDTYGYEYIITAKKFIRIANDGSTELFEDDVLDMGWNWSPVYIQVGNEVWFPNRDRGIFRVKLPTITNGVHDSSIPDAQILRHEIIRNNTLELLVEITNYQIYSVLGRQVMSGASESRIDVSDLSSGTYFIVCTVGNEVVSRKFVVSR
ncbi:MAG: T9SS type A sorting domain-containing protein, partial [Chlorobi bacterium]|nr:T9SS type A sorting domain-containing protein [Chlorobiota bacterium]